MYIQCLIGEVADTMGGAFDGLFVIQMTLYGQHVSQMREHKNVLINVQLPQKGRVVKP